MRRRIGGQTSSAVGLVLALLCAWLLLADAEHAVPDACRRP